MSEYNENEWYLKPPGIIAGSKMDQEITELLRKDSLEEKAREKDIPQGKNGDNRHYKSYHMPLAYVANFIDNTVSVVEIRTGRKVTDIPVGSCPYGIDISPNRKYVYAANMDDATLSVISTRKNRVVNTVDLNKTPFSADSPIGVKVSNNGKYIYVAGFGSNNLLVVSAHLQQVVAEVPFPEGTAPYDLDITADGQLAYITLLFVGKVAVVDLKVNLPVKLIDVEKWPIGVSIARRRSLAMVANQESKSLSAINTAMAEASPNAIDVNGPGDVVLSSRGNIAYVSNWDDSNIGIIDVFLHQQIGNIPVDDRPDRLALTADDRFLVVSNKLSNTVSIIDTRLREVTATATAGYHPAFIAILNQCR